MFSSVFYSVQNVTLHATVLVSNLVLVQIHFFTGAITQPLPSMSRVLAIVLLCAQIFICTFKHIYFSLFDYYTKRFFFEPYC